MILGLLEKWQDEILTEIRLKGNYKYWIYQKLVLLQEVTITITKVLRSIT